jgi:hypothetical protein
LVRPAAPKLARQPKWRDRGRLQVAANRDATFVRLCEQLEADPEVGPLYKSLLHRWFGPKFIQDPEFRTRLEHKFDRDSRLTKALIYTEAGAKVILDDSLFDWIGNDIARYEEPEQRGYYKALRNTDAGAAADLIDAVRSSRGNATRRSFAPVAERKSSAAGGFTCKVEGCPNTKAKTTGFTRWDSLIRHAGTDHPNLPKPVRDDYAEELEAEPQRVRVRVARGATRRKPG